MQTALIGIRSACGSQQCGERVMLPGIQLRLKWRIFQKATAYSRSWVDGRHESPRPGCACILAYPEATANCRNFWSIRRSASLVMSRWGNLRFIAQNAHLNRSEEHTSELQ